MRALPCGAAGIGELHLADFGCQGNLTNLQRQIIHDTANVGESKVDSASRRLRLINPLIKLVAHRSALDADSLAEAVSAVDLVLDCCDNFATREAVNKACVAARKPLVSGAAIRLEGSCRCLIRVSLPVPATTACTGTAAKRIRPAASRRMGPLVGLVGSLQALEALKILAGFGEPLVGRLLLVDALSTRFRELRVKRDPACSVWYLP